MSQDKTPTGTFALPPVGAPHEVAEGAGQFSEADIRARRAAADQRAAEIAAESAGGEARTNYARPDGQSPRLPDRLRVPARPDIDLTVSHGDVSAAAQATYEAAVQEMARLDETLSADLAVGPASAATPAPRHMPAASDTDTPSRGQPRAIADPGKQITGGFGDLGQAQYYPLDGSEARVLICDMLDKLKIQLQNDLRFSMAVTYARLQALITIDMRAWAQEPVIIQKLVAPVGAVAGATPVEVAEAAGFQPIDMVLTETTVEMTDEGESVLPPNAIREGLGMVVPRKQIVPTPGGKQFVDVV
jgi:hypothetical protein